MQESIAFLVRVQCRRKESSRSLSHLLMSFLLYFCDDDAAVFTSTRRIFFDNDARDSTSTTSRCFFRRRRSRSYTSTRWTSYVVPQPPKGGSKTNVSKIWTISCDNYETVRDRMSVTINQYNRKSHTSFRSIPTSMTLNDLARRNSHYFAFFLPNSIAFAGQLRHSGCR